jgi:tetratricopeptide (TPR) repeat protein
MRALLCSLVWLLGCAACGRDAPAPPVRAAPPAPKAWPRVHSPELDLLRRALDLGPLAEVERLIGSADSAGPEQRLLRARFAAGRGRGIEALRLVEEARAADPKDPSVYATAAEIYAASDGFESASREIVQGEQACGPSAELLRARGIVSLSRQGGAARGLADLEAARAADPQLPFAARALGQAHLLLGKEAVKKDQLAAALEHALLSISYDPFELDAQRFVSECQAARGQWDAALAVLRRLVGEGHPLQSELALMEKRAGVACLLRDDKPGALAHFLEARARGLSDEELATGARLLAEASEEHVAAGLAAYEKRDLVAAEKELRAALVYDAGSLAAQNHLAVVLFRRQRYPECIELWKGVLATAREEELELPEPVHLNLAEAQRAGGDPGAARATLEGYLAESPAGKWCAATREALQKLGH